METRKKMMGTFKTYSVFSRSSCQACGISGNCNGWTQSITEVQYLTCYTETYIDAGSYSRLRFLSIWAGRVEEVNEKIQCLFTPDAVNGERVNELNLHTLHSSSCRTLKVLLESKSHSVTQVRDCEGASLHPRYWTVRCKFLSMQ